MSNKLLCAFLHINGTIPASYLRTTGVNHKTTKRTNEIKKTEKLNKHIRKSNNDKRSDDERTEIILLILRK